MWILCGCVLFVWWLGGCRRVSDVGADCCDRWLIGFWVAFLWLFVHSRVSMEMLFCVRLFAGGSSGQGVSGAFCVCYILCWGVLLCAGYVTESFWLVGA